jgi:hypothetical protein
VIDDDSVESQASALSRAWRCLIQLGGRAIDFARHQKAQIIYRRSVSIRRQYIAYFPDHLKQLFACYYGITLDYFLWGGFCF